LEGDFHVHSNVSDGLLHPIEILVHARKADLDVISITDHDSFEGSIKAVRYLQHRGIERPIVIVGCEARTLLGDVLVYCEEPLPRIPKGFWELVDLSRDGNCILVPAHPFDTARLGMGKSVLVVREYINLIECYNAYSSKRSNGRAYRLAKLLKKPCIANSDAHIPEFIGVYRTRLLESSSSPGEVLETLRKGLVHPMTNSIGVGLWVKRALWSVKRSVKRRIG